MVWSTVVGRSVSAPVAFSALLPELPEISIVSASMMIAPVPAVTSTSVS